jgi:hypothetical protein
MFEPWETYVVMALLVVVGVVLIVATFSLTSRRPSSNVSESTITLDAKGKITAQGPTKTTVSSSEAAPSALLIVGLTALGTALVLAAGFYPVLKSGGSSGRLPNPELYPQLADALDRRIQGLPPDQRPSTAQIAAALNLGVLLASLQAPLLKDPGKRLGAPASDGASPDAEMAFWDGVALAALSRIQEPA